MGKKARKTRWRTLSISEQRSDSEESSSNPGPEITKSYHHNHHNSYTSNHSHSGNKFYSKFPYSSQSTPTRRYQHESTKSTRSSSTASEHKITFNEDEYTKITTPRQDVLFKKGYLSKPKTYLPPQNGGTSTGNSTGNGTPDHQSADGTEGTDLEYEHTQFMYPNGFVDQNGIYYVQNFDPFPMVIYNPGPVCYPEYPNTKYNKRYSTDSLTESTSPNNEENIQELSQSGGETSGNGAPEFGTVYNVLYPGFVYNNSVYPVNDLQNGGQFPSEMRRVKKRRRRKLSPRPETNGSTSHEGTTDEFTEDEEDAEYFSESEESYKQSQKMQCTEINPSAAVNAASTTSDSNSVHIPSTLAEEQTMQESQGETCNTNGFEVSTGLPAGSPETNGETAIDDAKVVNGDHKIIILEDKQTTADAKRMQETVAKTNEEEISKSTVIIVPVAEKEMTHQHVKVEHVEVDVVPETEAQNLLLNGLSKEQDPKKITLDETVSLSVASKANHDLDEEKVNVGEDSEGSSCSKISSSRDLGAEDAQDDSKAVENVDEKPKKTVYRVDAEEFVPRAFRAHETAHQLPVLSVPAGFVPLSVISDPAFSGPFLPPVIPINFIPSPDPKLIPNFVNFIPPNHLPPTFMPPHAQNGGPPAPQQLQSQPAVQQHPEQNLNAAKPANVKQQDSVDIAKIVSKLEEAAMEQQQNVRTTEGAEPSPVHSNEPAAQAIVRQATPTSGAQTSNYDRSSSAPFRTQKNQNSFKNRRQEDTKFKSRSYDRNYRPNGDRQTPQKSPENHPKNSYPMSPLRKQNFSSVVTESQKVQTAALPAAASPHFATNPADRRPENNSPRRFDVSNAYNVVSNRNQTSPLKENSSRAVPNDYSETLKRNRQAASNGIPRNSAGDSTKTAKANSGSYRSGKYETTSQKIETSVLLDGTTSGAVNGASKPQKTADNRWISVQSRKKRKNGGQTGSKPETDDWPLEEELKDAESGKEVDKEFEEYDVSLLVDVVVAKPVEIVQHREEIVANENASEKYPQNVAEVSSEAPKCVPMLKTLATIHAGGVQQLQVKENGSVTECSAVTDVKSSLPEPPAAPAVEAPAAKELAALLETAKCTKSSSNSSGDAPSPPKANRNKSKGNGKKSGTAKPLQKRVIITDIDLSGFEAKECVVKSAEKEKQAAVCKKQNVPKTIERAAAKEVATEAKLAVEQTLQVAAALVQNGHVEKSKEAAEETKAAVAESAAEQRLTVTKVADVIAKVQTSPAEKPSSDVVAAKVAEAAPISTPSAETSTSKSPERKTQSKKKKKPKSSSKQTTTSAKEAPTKLNHLSSSLLNGLADPDLSGCGDFLDTTLGEEIHTKTNVEISQELDRMIQRGLYANLEEKMRSLNPGHSADKFFKSVVSASPLDSSFNAFLKSSSSAKENGTSAAILLPSTPKLSAVGGLKVANGHVDSKKIELDLKKIVEKSAVAEVLQQQEAKNDSKTTLSGEAPAKNGPAKPPLVKESLIVAPITQAVKEWMSKTRENTPELEILKSPSEIKQQFFIREDLEDDSDDLSSEEVSKVALATPETKDDALKVGEAHSEEDVVVFNAEVDLLECWDDEMASKTCPQAEASPVESTVPAKDRIEQGEDVLEVYESVYGQNSDYLKLKAEVEQETLKTQRQRFAKHGDLPYRAICCSVM